MSLFLGIACSEMKLQCPWLRRVTFGSLIGSTANGTNALKLHVSKKKINKIKSINQSINKITCEDKITLKMFLLIIPSIFIFILHTDKSFAN